MNSEIAMQGRLDFLNLGEVLQLIGSNGSTGTLRITSPYADKAGQIYFLKGNIVNATTPNATGLDAAYELFGWLEGAFEFYLKETLNVPRSIQSNRMEIILDGLRQLDDGLIPKLGRVAQLQDASGQAQANLLPIRGPLVDYTYVVNEEQYAAGQNFAKENSYGEWVWVILEGVVDIVKATPGGPLVLLRQGTGALIGNLFSAFSFQSNVRSVSAIASNNVRLGVLDTFRISKELTPISAGFKKLLLSLENRKRQVIDKTVEMYVRVNAAPKDAAPLTSPGKPDGPVIIEQGQTDPVFFQITAGNVDIVRHSGDRALVLAHLGPGDFIGQMPFWDIGHEPQFASVYGSADCQTNPLDPNEYLAEYELLPTSLKNMIENIAVSIPVITRRLCEFQK